MILGEVQVCVECGKEELTNEQHPSGAVLLNIVGDMLKENEFAPHLEKRAVACLGNCDHRCRLAVVSGRKWSWSLGDIDPERDTEFLQDFFKQWLDAPNGLIAKKDRSDALIDKALGRNPPFLVGQGCKATIVD